jgi:hypothetical protein
MKKTLLITVTYTDSTDKFWMDSSIKNKRVLFDPETQNIHEVVKELCEDKDYMELVYNGKPQGNVYRDVLDKKGSINGYETVGYMYRGRTDIYRPINMSKPETGRFDVWVTIDEVVPFAVEDLS